MRRLILGATFSLATLSGLGHAQTSPPAGDVLASDSVLTRRGAVGDLHSYSVDLDVDTFIEISVTEEAADVGINVLDGDGTGLLAVDVPNVEHERMMFTAPHAGRYRIDVRMNERISDHQYVLRVVALRPVTEQDRRRDRCFKLFADGGQLARKQTNLAVFGSVFEMLEQAASCWRAESDVDWEIETLSSLAGLSGLFSQFRLVSASAYERLIPLLQATGQMRLELLALEGLLAEYNDDGRFDRSRDTATALRELAAKQGDRRTEGRANNRLAFVEFSLGNYESARRAALAALDIAKEQEDATVLATAHLQLGRIDDVAGDYDAALARYEQGLRATTSDRQATTLLRNALGFLRFRRGEYDEAARQFEARLALASQFVQRDTEAMARVGLGDVRLARGDHEGAGKMYEEAAEALRRGMPSLRCIAIQRLGRHTLNQGRLDDAAGHFSEMLAINEQMGSPPCEAEAQAGIADVAFQRGDLETADNAAQQVIRIAEQFREATPSLESRALGFGALAPAFDRAVEITMKRAEQGESGAAARALVLNERALARGLLDHISQSGWDESRGGPESLASDRRRLREQWRVRVSQYQVAAQSPRDQERAKTLQREMTALDLQLRDLEARSDEADARRARLIRPQVLELDAIRALLDEDTRLVEYALGERESYAWVVSSRDMHAFRLAPRGEIESAAHAVHRDLTTAASAVQPGADERRRALARLVLAPVASQLAGRRLVIVSAGALSLVPFAVLPFELEAGDTSTLRAPDPAEDRLRQGSGESTVASAKVERVSGVPLLSRFEIVHAPSATTLAAMRALTERRPRPRMHTVVFADPIFEAGDPRASGTAGAATKPPSQTAARSPEEPPPSERPVARTLAELGASFPRLPFSRAEANALRELAPGQVRLFLDGLATRDRALGPSLGDYRFIHFATHGIVHPEVPSLSSIVLSFVDGAGGRRDPFLTLPDIYEMRLSADVVVLSACSTAEGKHVPGEGPIGLARGFMYAGAPRVIASFWRVNDMATAELMKRFYRGMLMEGLTAAAALRAAQQQVAAIPRWSSPYYWAPFVLQGDWR